MDAVSHVRLGTGCIVASAIASSVWCLLGREATASAVIAHAGEFKSGGGNGSCFSA